MSKLVIFGATGQQGHSILTHVHNDPVLSKQYSIRAVTRNTTSATAQEIAKNGIEVVQADIDNPASLSPALENAHTVILITATEYVADLKEREFQQTKAVGDAAVAAGAKFLIYSTAVKSAKFWNGRPVDAFDSKAEAEDYLRGLPLKTAFFAPGMFMQNLATFMAPRPVGDGTYQIASIVSPDAKIPMIDIVGNSGTFVASLLANPEASAGVTLYAATTSYSFKDMVEIISQVSGKKVNYVQIPEQVYAGFMPPHQGQRMVDMMQFFEDVGYFGPETESRIAQTVERVDGSLSTFKEFADKYMADF